MMASGHIVVGLVTYQAVVTFFGYPPTIPGYVLAVIGSLLPDIDHPKSRVGRLCPPLTHAISSIFGHRGITHSLFALVGVTLLAFAAGDILFGAVGALCIGYLSHLAADFLTHAGIPLLWPAINHPFPRPNIRMPVFHFRTGGRLEFAIILLGVTLLAYSWLY